MKPLSDQITRVASAIASADRLLPLFAVALPLAALVQIKLPFGPAGIAITLSDIVVAVAIPIPLVRSWRHQSLNVDSLVPRLPVWLALLTLVLIIGISVGLVRWGFQSWTVTRLIGWIVILAHLLVASWIASETTARRLATQTFVIAAAAIIAVDLVTIFAKTVFVAPENCGWVEPAFGLTPNPNSYAFMLLMAIAVTANEMRRDLFGRQAVNAGLVTVLAFDLILTSSRSAWTAAIVVAIIALVAGWTRRLQLVIGAAIGVAMAALLIKFLVCSTSTAVTDDIHGLGAIVTNSSSMDAPMTERLYTYRRAIEMFMEHPFIGAGIGAFLAAELARGSWALIIHSTPLWLLGEIGLLGAGCFAAFAIAVLVALVAHIRNGPPERKGDAITALLIVIAFGIMSMAQELLYQRSLWIVLALFIFAPKTGVSVMSRSHGSGVAGMVARGAATRP